MFGNNDRKLEKLQKKGGVKAHATITEATRSRMAFTSGDPSIVSNTSLIWKLTLQVQPPDGQPPFEANVEQRYSQERTPSNGDTVVVYYDPSDPSTVAIDMGDGAAIEASIEHHREWREMSGMRPDAAAYANNLENAAIGDPYEFADAFKKDRRAAILASKERVRAAVAAAQAAGQVPGMNGMVITPGTAPFTAAPATPAAADPIAQLSQLADLRDRGVLSADEFEAQKRRVLGES
jgi:Short C-terminal domain